jgi:hypothetical protein
LPIKQSLSHQTVPSIDRKNCNDRGCQIWVNVDIFYGHVEYFRDIWDIL